MTLTVKCNYISTGCNKTPHAADWGSDGLICYGASNAIALFDPAAIGNDSRITDLLHHHKGRVNSVRWLREKNGLSRKSFLSGSADSTIILWADDGSKFTIEAVLEKHNGSVTVVDGLILDTGEYQRNQTNIILATASSDSTVNIWGRGTNGEVLIEDCLSFGNGFALDVRLAIVSSSILLACAVDDCKIHLFYKDKKTSKFQNCHVILGHEDWIRALDFYWADDYTLYLAAGGQDSFVRVYKLSVKEEREISYVGEDVFETELSLLNINDSFVTLQLETVLAGHENWVYGVSWWKNSDTSVKTEDALQLLTSSMDKTLVVWAPRDGLWVEIARVGEVGGNTLGFYGGKFGPDGRSILAHGYQGSFHLWRLQKDDCWEPDVVVGGHVGAVTDISWAECGQYLLTCSEDQTTRLHAVWMRDGKRTWHEISRPQVHGHDISCIASISDTLFVSGADEIVLRAFTAPRNFLENFERICSVSVTRKDDMAIAPEGASVPALGLSNKPVFAEGNDTNKDPDLCFSPITLHKPPTEENLLQNTLWPEVQKLYGHGYEIRCVAARPDGAIIASACRATQKTYAAVILWETKTWTKVQELQWHDLTVLQMAFSHDGNHLLTVSRDRKWCLYKLDEAGTSYFVSATGVKTPHTRVIWCCSWATDGRIFATGSRDGNICLWNSVDSSLVCTNQEPTRESVTAMAFSPSTDSDGIYLVVGTDSGVLHIYKLEGNSLHHLKCWQSHGSTINRIQFRRNKTLDFASCSKDHSVKIYQLQT